MTQDQKITHIRTHKAFGLGDGLVAGILAFAILFTVLVLYLPKSPSGQYAEIRVNGQLYGSYRLDTDTSVSVEGKLTVVIESNCVYVIEPLCSDKVCALKGKIARVHEVIVCVPQGITVRVTGTSDIHAEAR